MKFSAATIFATALSASNALASTTVKLYADDGSPIKHFGIEAQHGGAGFDNIYLSPDGTSQTLEYDEGGKSLGMKAGHYTYFFYIDEQWAQLGVTQDPAEVTLDDSMYLNINGSPDGFYGCTNVTATHNNTQSQYELLYEPGDTTYCFPLKLKAE